MYGRVTQVTVKSFADSINSTCGVQIVIIVIVFIVIVFIVIVILLLVLLLMQNNHTK